MEELGLEGGLLLQPALGLRHPDLQLRHPCLLQEGVAAELRLLRPQLLDRRLLGHALAAQELVLLLWGGASGSAHDGDQQAGAEANSEYLVVLAELLELLLPLGGGAQ